MSIDERIKIIAARRRPIMSFCAIRQLNEQQQQEFFFKRLMFEYSSLPDDKKQQWLDEQESAQ